MELKYNVLIVDDVVENIQIAMNILREENYNLTFALSGEEALKLFENNHFDIILLDIMMPDMDGYIVCEEIRKIPHYAQVPIIFLTAKTDIDAISKAFEKGGSDYVAKPFHADELLSRVKSHLELHRARLVLEQNNLSLQAKVKYEKERLLTEVEAVQKEIIYTLTELIENCSTETGRHVVRVASMAELLAKYDPSLSDEDAYNMYHASPLHDIGKIAIPNEILDKPGALTDDEFEVMKTHTTLAHQFLKHSKRQILKSADIIASEHHEWWNGTGYPKGLKGENIHPYGRIMAIVDVFDALMNKRVYKEAWDTERAITYMKDHAETHFDPKLIKIFMENIDEFVAISKS